MGQKTMFVLQEAHANTLAMNKDSNQVVIAGRNIYKIFAIDENELVEKINLRVGKHMNLNYSTGDVAWSHYDENILATAATNGSVVTWRLDKPSLSKQDTVFQDHRRTVNKVNFHPLEPHLLLSGSQDGTMKLFDLRKKEVVFTFHSNAESVRDVEFNPLQNPMFAAVQENGNVQLWDLRKTDRCQMQFTAHSGPVFACDWHPEDRRWLATAGRDKTIKVWDMFAAKPSIEYTIQTISPVARVKWRPHRRYHIASSALVMDFSINVWDVRRPYIPFAAFTEHKDVTTGIAWRQDPHTFLTTSKDNTLYQHSFRDATRPADKANPSGLAINCTGDLCLALSDKIQSDANSSRESYTSTKLPAFFRKVPNLGDQFCAAISSLNVFKNMGDKHLSTSWFVESAKEYQLAGRTVTELCEHNSAVASHLERPQEATTWSMLKLLYAGCNASVADVGRLATLDSHRSSDLEKGFNASETYYSDAPDQRSGRHQSGSNHRHHSGGKGEERQPGDTSTGLSEEEAEPQAYNQSDIFLGDGEGFDPLGMNNFDPMEEATTASRSILTLDDKMKMIDWVLPTEAFQPRFPLLNHSPPPEHLIDMYTHVDEDEDSLDAKSRNPVNNSWGDGDSQLPMLSIDSVMMSIPLWDCTPIVVEMIHFYAEQGNVQMSVSILLILGDRIKSFIEESVQEDWYFVYIDLLARFKLYTIANHVIKLSPLASINSLNQQSTSIRISCNCGRPLGQQDWVCERCKSRRNICAICHQVVRGLYVWCQGCAHGGHLQHIKEWTEANSSCPAGCGHQCQYV